LLRQLTKLQKRKARLRGHGLAISVSCGPRATRVFTIHGSASLYISSTQNARAKRIITVKGSFEVSDLCDKEFHKMAQNFGMIASYAEKMKSTTMEGVKLLEGCATDPEMKKPRVEASREDKVTEEEEKATMA
jgi:hypothetical protein